MIGAGVAQPITGATWFTVIVTLSVAAAKSIASVGLNSTESVCDSPPSIVPAGGV